MLELEILPREVFDERTNEFYTINGGTLQLEHSLLSVARWEAETTRPFLSQDNLSDDDLVRYIKCMTMRPPASQRVYQLITADHIRTISEYIQHPHSATTIRDTGKRNRDIITSEVIYSWMCGLDIPFSCEKWHLNRLLKLIEVRSIHTQPPEKSNPRDIAMRNHALNIQRRARLKTKG